MNISYQKSQKNLRAGFEQQKITQNIAFFSDKVVNETPKIIINHQVLPVSTKNHKWWPGIPNNQPTWTSNKVLNHFVPRLWGLHKRKVLKSILHCICKIFISPGNSSAFLSSISTKHSFTVIFCPVVGIPRDFWHSEWGKTTLAGTSASRGDKFKPVEN